MTSVSFRQTGGELNLSLLEVFPPWSTPVDAFLNRLIFELIHIVVLAPEQSDHPRL